MKYLCIAIVLSLACLQQARADDNQEVKLDKDFVGKFLTTYQRSPFEDRGKYVSDPKEYDKAQAAYYKDKTIPDEVETTVTSVKAGPKPGYYVVVARHKVALNGRTSTMTFDYLLINTRDGLKLDWSANVGYNPVGWTEWAAGKDETLTLRIEAKLADFYNYHYREDKDSHYSVQCKSEFGDRNELFWAYALKDSDLGKRVLSILKDGQKHKLVVTIERTGREAKCVGIKEIVSETWIR